MSPPIVVGLSVIAVSAAIHGMLLARTSARLTAAALVLFSLVLGVAALTWSASRGSGLALVAFAWGLCFPVALLAYPRAAWSHPVDFVLWAIVLAAGAVLVIGGHDWVEPGALVIVVTLIAHFLWRFEHSSPTEKVALLWMALAVGASGMIVGHTAFLVESNESVAVSTVVVAVGLVAIGLVPFTLAIGILRPELVDVRGLIIEAVVLEVAVLGFVAVFVGVTSAAEIAGAEDLPIGAFAMIAAVTALGFNPLRASIRSAIDDMLFGSRPDPLDAATRVADEIGDDPVQALTVVREAMVLPFASLVVGGEEVAVSGTPVPHTRRLTLALGADEVGEVVVGLRPGDLRLSPADERVFRIVAPLLAQTLRARSLAADLRVSRGAAISAIEEERRRIRNDLHDGLGPRLSGMAFTADAARNSLGDRQAADDLLRALRVEASNAISEIRRLVYGLRPPALDELGLIGALKQWVTQIRTADGRLLVVDIDAPDHFEALPAAVEVAAYRIVVEALANVARHSGSDRAELHLAVDDDTLTIDIRDHGARADQAWRPGVGMASMSERAASIGGTLAVRATPEGGSVIAVLPIP